MFDHRAARLRRRAAHAVALLVLTSSLMTPSASAQTASESQRALAREQFKAGVQAAKKGEWEKAHDAFTRAYELTHRPLILMNLAGAQVQTGRLVEASESYRSFIRTANKPQEKKHIPKIRSVLEELDGRIPRAVLRVRGLEDTDTLQLDGQPLSSAALESSLPLNPGAHALSVIREGATLASTTFELLEGRRTEVQLDATVVAQEPPPPPPPPPPLTPPTQAVEPPDDGVPPVVWVVTGIVAVASAVAIGLLVTQEEDPYRGSTNIVVHALGDAR